MTWSNKQHQVYSERTDLSPEAFELLVRLTLQRRREVTADNALELWRRDREVVDEAVWYEYHFRPVYE